MATQKQKQDYLINLGFDIKGLSSQEIDQNYKRIQLLDRAFQTLGGNIGRAFDNQTLDDFFNNAEKRLRDFAQSVSATILKISTSAGHEFLDLQRALGDTNLGNQRITPSKTGTINLAKSHAGNVVFPNIPDAMDMLDTQTGHYTIRQDDLGDKVSKTRLKWGIESALQRSNDVASVELDKLRKILESSSDDITKYIEKSETEYDNDGKAVRSWVTLKLNEYQKLKMGLKYVTDTQNINGQDKTYGIGVRDGMEVSTDQNRAVSDLEKAYSERERLEKQLSQASEKGNVQTASELNNLLTQNQNLIDQIEQAYRSLFEDQTGADETIKRIQDEYNARRDLTIATQQDARTKEAQKSVLDSITKSLKEYNAVSESTAKIEASGQSEAYSQKLQQNEQELQRLQRELSLAGQGVVTIDQNTQEASVNVTNLTTAFANNREAAKKVRDAVDQYNKTLQDRKSAQAAESDQKAIQDAINKTKELIAAQEKLKNLKNQKASTAEIDAQTKKVEQLKNETEQLTNATLSSGTAVGKTKAYTDAYKEALDNLANSQNKSNTSTQQSSSLLDKLSGKFSTVISNVIKYNAAQFSLNTVVNKTIGTIKSLDESMTEVRLVTGESAESARNTMNSYADLAKQLGATTQEVASGSVEWL